LSKTPLKDLVKPYAIFKRAGLKIGIIGIGIDPAGLIPAKKCENIVYLNPIETANRYALMLKQEQKCDVVIVLSHLGYKYDPWENKISDLDLAAKSRNIDVILGGHTHTFLKEVKEASNLDGKPVVVNQAGKSGLIVDKLELEWK
jgi:5'-nucleotidase